MISEVAMSNLLTLYFQDMEYVFGFAALFALIALLLLIPLSFAVKAYRTRHPKNPTSVRARVLSNDLTGGKVDVLDRGREVAGNTYGRVAYHRLSFWCEEKNEELNFTIGENDERYKTLHPGDEGTLTYSKNVFLSFVPDGE